MTDDERIDAITQMCKEIDALEVLMESEWWSEECENANYHDLTGPFSFMAECIESRTKERNAA